MPDEQKNKQSPIDTNENEVTPVEGNKKAFNDTQEKEDRFIENWRIYSDFENSRNQHIRFLNKNGEARNIIDYVNDSVDRMNEFHLKPAFKEDWQNNVFDPKTRDKLIAILSILAPTRMKPELHIIPTSIFNTEDLEFRRSVYSDLLENSNNHNDEDQQLLWEMYTGMSEGTVFGFESWMKDTREVEYVKEFDPDTGEKVTETIKYDAWDDVFGEIMPIDEVYPENIFCNAKDFYRKNTRLFWAREMNMQNFKDAFAGFSGSEDVEPASNFLKEHGLPWGISEDVNQKNVQVLYKFDVTDDKMGIWANGKELYWGCMPWNHKELPVWIAINEPIHHQFLYGKSLPDKMMGMQDINNAVWNSMLDQLFIALNSPIFIDGMADLDEGYLEPGRIIEMEPGTKIQRATLGNVDPISQQMLALIQRSIEETTLSAQNQGVPTGGRKTKFEVQQLQEGALNLAGLALQLMESGQKRKYWLRMHNIIQYYSMPSRRKTGKKKFQFIKIENRPLTNKQTGTRIIQVVDNENQVPSKEELQEIGEKEEGKPFDVLTSRVEPIVLTRDFFMNKEFDLDMKIIPNASVKQTQADKDRKVGLFYQSVTGNPLFDQVKVAKIFAKMMGQPEDLVITPQAQSPEEQLLNPEGQGQQGGGGGNNLPNPDLL